MKWNGIFSNRYIHTIMDCNKYCQDIQNKIYQINQEKLEIQPKIKDRLTPNILDRTNKLDDEYEKLSDELKVCIVDCERRKRDSSVSVKEDDHPIDEKLSEELRQLDSDDDDADLNGGNKRRRRRRRSFRNKTKRTQRRGRQQQRNQRRNTRRGRSRSRITSSHRK